MEKTKKCKVVISCANTDNGVYNSNWRNFPIVVSGKNIYQSFSVEGMALLTDDYFAHIDFVDERGETIASTDSNVAPSYPISQAFIKKFVEMNGSIKEVLVEMVSICRNCINPIYHTKEDCLTCKDWRPKLSSKGMVITHPVKTEMKIEDMPIEAIKNCLAYCEEKSIYDKLGYHGDFYYRMKKWIDSNNL